MAGGLNSYGGEQRNRSSSRGGAGTDWGTAASPASGRFRRPGWREPRLLIGVGLVVAAVAGTTATMALTSTTEQYRVAARDLDVGTRVSEEDFRTVEVRLEGTEGAYLPGSTDLADGAVIVDRVPSGQLVPTESVGEAQDLGRRPMGIPLNTALPAGTGAGDSVDLWVSKRESSGRGWSEPEQILEGAELASVDQATGTLGAGQQMTAQVLVEEDDVSDVVDALATESRITVVPHIGGGR
ncbi:MULTISPECIES: SAF domain-containing protein [Kocuria]|nr:MULTISPECIES: SAF domain-containing protein [Kocuria]